MKQHIKDQNIITSKIFTLPNILSLFRLCLIPCIVWLYCIKHKYSLAGLVLILSGITDMADGFLARRLNMISELGKLLDPIADKLTQASMMLCLTLRFPLMLLPLAVMALKETFTSITGLLVIRKEGSVPSADWHGKAATCLLYAMMILHIFWYGIPSGISAVLIILCTVMIGISFLLYGIGNLRTLKLRRRSGEETSYEK